MNKAGKVPTRLSLWPSSAHRRCLKPSAQRNETETEQFRNSFETVLYFVSDKKTPTP